MNWKKILKSRGAFVIGLFIVLVAGVTTWALHRLIYDGLTAMLAGYSSFEQNLAVVIGGVLILALMGHNFIKKYGKK